MRYFTVLLLLILLCTIAAARITPPPAGPVTMDAEWEEREGIIVSYPWYPWFPFGNLFNTLSAMIDHLQEYGVVYIRVDDENQANQCASDLAAVGVPMHNIEFIYYPGTPDNEWTRDYGPQFIWEDDSTLSIADQRYFEGQQINDDFPDFLATLWGMTYYGADMQNEGGNMMTDGHGTMVMTDNITNVNPGMTLDEIMQNHQDYFGQDTVNIFQGIPGWVWNHIDGIAKFMNDTTIMIAQLDPDDPDYELVEQHAAAMAEIPTVYGTPFNIVRIQEPYPWLSCYSNGLLFNGLALVPIYGEPEDQAALDTYQEILGEDWDVIGINCYWINWLGGAIHCTTIGVPRHDWDYLVDASLDMEPSTPPVIIPPGGGSFEYNLEVGNLEADTIKFDLWIDVTLPGGGTYGPILKRESIQLPEFGQITRELMQFVPGYAPEGIYTYNAYLGSYLPRVISAEEHFDFEKTGISDSGQDNAEWLLKDINMDASDILASLLPESIEMPCVYPNPFNPTTVLSFKLQVASKINLAVYDIAGRQVTELVDGWREAGTHEVVFDAAGLASGMYFYRLEAGKFTAQGKMVLVK